MRKMILASLLAVTMTAQAQGTRIDSVHQVSFDSAILHALKPTLTKDFVQLGKFGQHWFVGIQGGASAFIGSPVGCGDLFDRITPSVNIYAGKWITPDVGLRASFQGFRFKNADLLKSNYQLYHADLMYNMANLFRQPSERMPNWDLIPYLGLGLAHGKNIYDAEGLKQRNYQFALTYGLQARYNISQRFFLSSELGCFTTFKDFDGIGDRGKFGDHMLSLSVGVGLRLGNPRWKYAIDANPYISQNDYLLSYVSRLEDNNKALRNRHNIDQKTLDELKKILTLEGLLDKYGYLFDEQGGNDKNNYRGLLSLRARMNRMADNRMPASLEASPNVLNVPIFFFFKLGKAQLEDESQLINLDELAKVVNLHNLKIRIVGAADSATGTDDINETLSEKRSRFIAKELQKRGVSSERISTEAIGGIDEYENPKDNRYSKITIYPELNQ